MGDASTDNEFNSCCCEREGEESLPDDDGCDVGCVASVELVGTTTEDVLVEEEVGGEVVVGRPGSTLC